MTLPVLSRSEAEAVFEADGFHKMESLSVYRFGEPDPQATEWVHKRYAFTRNQSIAYSGDVSAEQQRSEMDLGALEHLCLRDNTTADYVVRVLSRIVAAAVNAGNDPFDARNAVESKYSRLNEALRRKGENVHDLAEIFGSRRWLRDASSDLADLYELADRIFGGYIDQPDPASDGPSPVRMDEMKARSIAALRSAVSNRRVPRGVWERVPKDAVPHVLNRDKLDEFCSKAALQPVDAGKAWCLWVPRDEVEEGLVSATLRRGRRGKLIVVAISALPKTSSAPKAAKQNRPKARRAPSGRRSRRRRKAR